jgi:hypothetical protein
MYIYINRGIINKSKGKRLYIYISISYFLILRCVSYSDAGSLNCIDDFVRWVHLVIHGRVYITFGYRCGLPATVSF